MSRSDKEEIKSVLYDIKRQLFATLTQRTERWVQAETLSQEIECLRPEWLKRNGHLLPRTRCEVTQADGSVKVTRWVYPLHKINDMMANGEMRKLLWV